MLKKILYIIASFLLGFMIILYVINSAFYTAFAKINAEAVAEKDYDKAERYFSRAYDQDKFFADDVVGKDSATAHIEIYSALNDGIRYYEVLDEKGEVTSSTEYYSLESSIQVSLFHLPSSFDTNDRVDEEGNIVSQGGVKFIFSETESVFFPFASSTFDYYSLQSSFSFLGISVSEIEYDEALTKANISTSALMQRVEIYDGVGDKEFTITFAEGKNPTFDSKFHNTFKDVVAEYNELQLKSAKKEVVTQEQISAMENKYFTIAEESGYYIQHSTKTVYRSSKFITRIVIAVVVYTSIVVLIGWLIFRKKKAPKYVPPGYKNRMQYQQKKPAAPKREPEQFSREVFNLDKEDVSEK